MMVTGVDSSGWSREGLWSNLGLI